ncbi:FIST signal transduction protein [Pyxidicoccus xibeiensis]|uniref:FIST signal transduction protein n=1 Tax=Pyxidicoccus xibeiensis TaxID=2906759 RepID=UPI0020A79D69|nr:FIST N-terminal domain-containing protein [Pyxidicoccus xibeiensis]MCP3136872.1 FIST C-terminal domain-containing protein [Pyxidicoccus xibeiensis]
MGVALHIGVSDALEPRLAAATAVRQALEDDDAAPVLALAFATEQYDLPALAGALGHELGSIPWAGCSAAGLIAGEQLLSQGLVVGVLTGGVLAGVGVAGPVSRHPFESGRQAVEDALMSFGAPPPGHRRAVILLPDAFSANGDRVVQGATREAGAGVAWAGGGAGDNLDFVRTAQFAFGHTYQDHVVAVVLEAERPFGVGLQHGWQPYGPPVLATQTRGRAVVDLDFANAFDVYRSIAALRGDEVGRDDFARFAMLHPLGIPGAAGGYAIRDPLSVEVDGGLRFLAEIPDGTLLRMMEGEPDAIIAAAALAATEARERVGGEPAFGLVFDCVSRARLLGPRIQEELTAMHTTLGRQVPMMGCLTFGEVGSFGVSLPQFHNKTAVLLSLPA